MRNLQIFVCSILVLGVTSILTDEELFPVVNGYVQLDKHNFKAALYHFKFVFAFYFGRNRESKNAETEMFKVCEYLNSTNSDVYPAKIDADREPEIVRQFPIRATPTFRLFKNGQQYDYHGKVDSDKLITWLELAMMVPLQINTAHELQSLVETTCVILGCFPGKSPQDVFENFYKVSEFFVYEPKLPLPRFAVITSAQLAREIGIVVGSIAVYKKFEDGDRVVFSGNANNFTEVLQFVTEETYPIVFKLHIHEYMFYMNMKKGVYEHILFMNSNDRNYPEAYKNFKLAAKDYANPDREKNDVIFIHVDLSHREDADHLEYYHVDINKDLPCSRITKKDKYYSKFLPTTKQDFTYDGFKRFTDDVLSEKIQRDVRSETLPDDWDAYDVKIVVGDTLEEFVYKGQVNVVMFYYIPDDPKCEDALPVFNALAQSFRNNDTIVFGKINIGDNDGEVGDLADIPNVKMFLKDGKKLKYILEMNLEKLQAFIMTSGANQPKEENHHNVDINYINLQYPVESVEEEERRKKAWEEEERKILEGTVVANILSEPFDLDTYKKAHPFEHLPLEERDPDYMDPKQHAKFAQTLHRYEDEL